MCPRARVGGPEAFQAPVARVASRSDCSVGLDHYALGALNPNRREGWPG